MSKRIHYIRKLIRIKKNVLMSHKGTYSTMLCCKISLHVKINTFRELIMEVSYFWELIHFIPKKVSVLLLI